MVHVKELVAFGCIALLAGARAQGKLLTKGRIKHLRPGFPVGPWRAFDRRAPFSWPVDMRTVHGRG
jgi:hypothetical protein